MSQASGRDDGRHDAVFIVTAELDEASFVWLNALRQRHFPPARNYLDAHLTLFHQLDADGVAVVRRIVVHAAPGALPVRFSGLRKLGRGVAIEVQAPDLVALRARCANALADRLTAQDRQKLRPHVTVQNKVDPAAARATFDSLAHDFRVSHGSVAALLVWEYLGGPWRFVERLNLPGYPDGSPSV